MTLRVPSLEFERLVTEQDGLKLDGFRISITGGCVGCDHAAICLLTNVVPVVPNMRFSVPVLSEAPVEIMAAIPKGGKVEVSASIIAANAGMYDCELAAKEDTRKVFKATI